MTEPEVQATQSRVRFEATIHRGLRQRSIKAIPALDLDRVPDPDGEVRVLVELDDVTRLIQLGYEVHLLDSSDVRPLDPALIVDDDSAMAWLEDQVDGIDRADDDRKRGNR